MVRTKTPRAAPRCAPDRLGGWDGPFCSTVPKTPAPAVDARRAECIRVCAPVRKLRRETRSRAAECRAGRGREALFVALRCLSLLHVRRQLPGASARSLPAARAVHPRWRAANRLHQRLRSTLAGGTAALG